MCSASNDLLGSAERDLPHPSACATDAVWGLVTADAGINLPPLLVLTVSVMLVL